MSARHRLLLQRCVYFTCAKRHTMKKGVSQTHQKCVKLGLSVLILIQTYTLHVFFNIQSKNRDNKSLHLYDSDLVSCLISQVLFAAVLAGDVLILPKFGSVQRNIKLLTSIWDAVYLKEYIIIFKNTPNLWTVSKFELQKLMGFLSNSHFTCVSIGGYNSGVHPESGLQTVPIKTIQLHFDDTIGCINSVIRQEVSLV